jgi:hypothetical protein
MATAGLAAFKSTSLQVNFGMIGPAEAEQAFAREVMPHFKS